jgi:putative transposase
VKRSGTCCTAPVWTPPRQPLDIYRSINALCESFFATLECELLDRRRFPTQAEARMAVFDFIEGWYNPHRRHSGLDYESPIGYEQRHPVVA